MQANYVQRLRITFAKFGPTRFIGHLDLARALERSLNRAQVPLAYTQGYNPRPRMQLAAALPLGFTSECEMADFWLLQTLEPAAARKAMEAKMAPGIEIKDVVQVELAEPALQNRVTEADYVAQLTESIDCGSLRETIASFLAAERVMRERRGKQYDLRPLVLSLSLVDNGPDIPELEMHLSMTPGKTGRPDEVLAVLGLDPLAALIHRRQLILADG
ncbi:MAG TPA: TIGR03936 family radical SAM-associated protein [Anaerolineae bacterium]|jgi:radical SAM-linked protein|nr:TIGR03936 family radical SAM-associated protein [Anaerolineae bacterium]